MATGAMSYLAVCTDAVSCCKELSTTLAGDAAVAIYGAYPSSYQRPVFRFPSAYYNQARVHSCKEEESPDNLADSIPSYDLRLSTLFEKAWGVLEEVSAVSKGW